MISPRNTATTLILISILAGTEADAADLPAGPDLGRAAADAEIAARDQDVMPDGRGLPPGSGTVVRGRALYAQHCQRCHGENGLGDSGDQLAGAEMGLTSDWPEKTIGNFWPYAPTLFDFIRRSMPMESPGSLSDDEVYALTGYLLNLNGILPEDAVLDAERLARVRMPNRDGFADAWPEGTDAK
jgi:cytochrome c